MVVDWVISIDAGKKMPMTMKRERKIRSVTVKSLINSIDFGVLTQAPDLRKVRLSLHY